MNALLVSSFGTGICAADFHVLRVREIVAWGISEESVLLIYYFDTAGAREAFQWTQFWILRLVHIELTP